MAHSNVKISFDTAVFVLSLIFLVFMTMGSIFVTLAWSGGRPVFLSGYEIKVLIFTLKQATLSSMISCILAIPISRALFRKEFFLKEYIIRLLALPFILPVISAIFGLILVFGNNGLFNVWLTFLGLPKLPIYGLTGILIAHVFFNLPLAIRLLLLAWCEVPKEQFKLAASLGFKNIDFFWHIEWPMLKSVMPSALLLIFLICVTSFSIALALGGGPDSTTLEVAIYQALRFQLDFSKAASLALFQFVICSFVALLLLWLGRGISAFRAVNLNFESHHTPYFTKSVFDYFWICLSCCFLLIPLLLLFIHGTSGFFALQSAIYLAALNSLILSIASGFLGTFIAFYMSVSVWSSDSKAMRNHIEILSIFVLASSPIVMGTGIFLIVKPLVSFEFLTPLIVVCVNITMSLPFMLRALIPAVGKVEEDFGKLADSLNVKGYDRIRNIILPRVSPAVGFCLGIGAALSMGDLGVITLFSFGEFQTLPFAIYRLMVAYRIDQAFSASVLLIIICFFLFILFDLLGKYCATR